MGNIGKFWFCKASCMYVSYLYFIKPRPNECHHSTLFNSTLLNCVGLGGQTNATCCVEQTRIGEIRDLRRIMIPKSQSTRCPCLRDDSGRARIQQCWSSRPSKCNFVVHTWEQKKYWTMVYGMFDGNQSSLNMMQHNATWWSNKFNMLHSTMLNNVGSRCCTRLARA